MVVFYDFVKVSIKINNKIKCQILRFSNNLEAEMLSFSLIGYKLTFLGEFGLFPLKMAYWLIFQEGGGFVRIYTHMIQEM